jgi:hypothetical protein
MKHPRDFNMVSNIGLTEAARISALIGDLDRIVRIIDADIGHEEKAAGRFDLSDAAYPIVARMLRVRRDNLAKTIASLERRVSVILEGMERSDDWRPSPHFISNGRRSNAEQTS